MGATSIQWCDHSINPIRATHKATGATGHYCEKIAPGCKFCYSSKLQKRFKIPEFGGGQLLGDFDIWLDESKLDEVRRRKKPTRYFWEDMSDLFGHWVKQEWLDECFGAMDATPWHTHILLTKRPENIRRMWPSADVFDGGSEHKAYWPNVWLGTSVSDQATADAMLPALLECRDLAPVLFCSYEPALGPITLGHLRRDTQDAFNCLDGIGGPNLDWLIVGGESGPHARAFDIAWARSAIRQCKAAGVPIFVKQLGAKPLATASFVTPNLSGVPGSNLVPWKITDKKGGDISEFPADLRVREFPNSSAPVV